MEPPQDNNNDNNADYDIFREVPGESLDVVQENALKPLTPDVPPPIRGHRRLKRRLVIGAVVILTLILAGLAVGYGLSRQSAPKQGTNITINTQSLDNGTLNQLKSSNGGDSKQQLTISPDTLFQKNVTVDKDLVVQGVTSLQSEVTMAKNLTVGSNVAIGGNLSVTGKISAGILSVGTVTMGSLKLSGDIQFDGHLIPTGATPTIKTSIAAAGGTARLGGTDTAGNITIVAGNSPLISGEMAVITFRTPYGNSPKIQLTPTSASAAKLAYFVSHSAGFFTIEAAQAPEAGATYSFDYFVTQ